MDTRWKRRNKASFGQMAAFALVLATNPVLAFVICPNFSGAMGILLLLLSCAVCIGCTVFLFVRTGRVQGSDDIFLGESGALPTEVLAAVILFTPLLGMALGLSLGAVDVVIAGIGTAGGGVMLLCLLALARKWKAGRLIADSLLARVWPTLCRAARFAGRALRSILTGENHLNVHYPAGRAWVYRILWVCGVMAGLVVLSYLILSNQLLGVGNARWFGSGRYTAFAIFAIFVVTTGAGYLVWRSYRDAQSFDALLRQLDIAAKGDPAPVCVPEDSSLYAASKAVSDIGAHLQESVAAQMKSERMKLDLITNVSHDLKTPLTSIIGYLDLLEKQDDLPAGTRDYVLILRQKSERLATTVADLFTLAKATSGSEALAIEPLDLVMAVRQTLGDMNDSIRHTGVPVKATMPESAIVQADSGKLYRVLQNILDNALRYSLVGTRIYLVVSRGDIATRLTLTNTASYEMNFAPDDILQRFVRGDASRTTEGSGLGLSIAQTFMQNFGGGLEVGVQGDTFTVTLTFPAARPREMAPRLPPGWRCSEQRRPAAKTTAEIRSMRRSRCTACTPADVSGADADKARGACATAPETPEPCGVSTGVPDAAPVPEAPAGTPGTVESAHASGRPDGTDGCSPYGEAAAFSDKAAAAAGSPSETAARTEPKEPVPAESVPPSKTEKNSGSPTSVSPDGRRKKR
ncbi:MAG: histidine kinase dimerization/phospho-acceptor domain-containing protein [Ruthenibacterium lactatiformans]